VSKKPKPQVIGEKELERLRTLVSDEPGQLSYAHSRSGALVTPIDRGKIKGQAVEAMYQQTDQQLDQIAQQIQTLAQQYDKIKTRIELSERVYLADISFTPKIGQIYYLYEKKSGGDVLSMISPEEWGSSEHPYRAYLGAMRLLADHTWEVRS
jgi:hypothetical protein